LTRAYAKGRPVLGRPFDALTGRRAALSVVPHFARFARIGAPNIAPGRGIAGAKMPHDLRRLGRSGNRRGPCRLWQGPLVVLLIKVRGGGIGFRSPEAHKV